MHWAYVEAEKLLSENRHQVFALGYTPSGNNHIGSLREILTTTFIYEAYTKLGGQGKLIFIVDDNDPLRRNYDFLKNSKINYDDYVDKPLCKIPAPDGSHQSYAEYYMQPVIDALHHLNIHPTYKYASHMYDNGEMDDMIEHMLNNTDKLREILEEETGRQLPANWTPLDQNGKLAWRITWPARQKVLGVTFEAMGKDHGAAGGSWQTTQRIHRELLNQEPPHHLIYEFVQTKDGGAMHSSTGNGYSINEMLNVIEPEILRYLFARIQPNKHIDFDPGLPLLNLIDEFEQLERIHQGLEPNPGWNDVTQTYTLCHDEHKQGRPARRWNYRHLITLTQLPTQPQEVLTRHGLAPQSQEEQNQLFQRCIRVSNWLENYAPNNVKFTIQQTPPQQELTPEQKQFLTKLHQNFTAINWEAQEIHNTIHATSVETNTKMNQAFKTLYQITLNQTKGPRLGYLLQSLGQDWTQQRVSYYAN